MTVNAPQTLPPGLDALVKHFGFTVVEANGPSESKKESHERAQSTEKSKASKSNKDSSSSSGILTGDEKTAEDQSSKPMEPAGSIGTAKEIYRGKPDKDGNATWSDEIPDNAPQVAAENDETAQYAVVVRKMVSYDSRKALEVHSLVIQSQWLKTALGEIFKDYPGVSCSVNRLVFSAPFEPFVHRWAELLEYMKRKDLDAKTREHIELLHSIVKEELKDTIKAFEDFVVHGVITFEHLWTIFQPGSIVVFPYFSKMVAGEFRRGQYMETRCGPCYGLVCEVIDWGTSCFGRRRERIQIPKFVGTSGIDDLNAFPLAHSQEREGLRAKLISRGRLFESLAGFQYRRYNGYAITRDSEGKEILTNCSGRIVLDGEAWDRFSPYPIHRVSPLRTEELTKAPNAECYQKGSPSNSPRPGYKFRAEHHLICCPKVRGYSLKMKRWLEFFVDQVENIEWNNDAFNNLVLPEDQKELILSFTESQVENGGEFDDIIQGKGKGIIMLLSGPPGVGKTLTAESVSENMRVPLYMMSAGDLGTNPDQVERKLTEILEIVARWKAILLLDECDVFLEARSIHDLERNKLVSIFLRLLEYYEGILFLTTNRISNLDAAFQSRIHISMEYPDLTIKSRRKIWESFLHGRRHDLDGMDLDELAEVELNGRQIKNVLKTSQLLATRKESPLKRRFVETVLAIEQKRPKIPKWRDANGMNGVH